MPHTYMPTDDTAPLPGVAPDRAALGLPPTGKVLASFNQPLKIDRAVFACWMRLLAAVPGSVLWLAQAQRAAQANLRTAAAAYGIDPTRLVFARRLPDKTAHMARFHHVDLALDTARYNGHTTTIDALWAGVPVVVVKGRHFASRVSAGLVAAAGAPERVTGDLSAYEALALRLLHDDRERLALRAPGYRAPDLTAVRYGRLRRRTGTRLRCRLEHLARGPAGWRHRDRAVGCVDGVVQSCRDSGACRRGLG
ncbi:MAG: hypothetical protein FJX53_03915 [Alphaproteobacteria bacterium]|nr:hypothetical protein [Alphaproteobacteria bacterium]